MTDSHSSCGQPTRREPRAGGASPSIAVAHRERRQLHWSVKDARTRGLLPGGAWGYGSPVRMWSMTCRAGPCGWVFDNL
jgi:hypothetical protein